LVLNVYIVSVTDFSPKIMELLAQRSYRAPLFCIMSPTRMNLHGKGQIPVLRFCFGKSQHTQEAFLPMYKGQIGTYWF
jgi:hypothetical protein